MLSIEEIRKRLKDRNITQVANLSGLSPSVIYHLYRGGADVKHDTVVRLSDYLENPEKYI